MICLFEGPDGAGKSTLIQAVADAHIDEGHLPESVQVWRAGPFPQDSDPWTEYVHPVGSLRACRDWIVLIDRWHLGELVYGPIFRSESRLSLEQRVWIEGYLKTMGAVLIHVTASHDELARRLGERGDDMVAVEHLQPILDGYAELVGDGHQPRVFYRTYDTTSGPDRIIPFAASIYVLARMETSIAISAQNHPSARADPRPYWEKNPWPS